MKNVNHPSMSLFSLILLLPIFISFGTSGNVGLGRIGAIDDAVWLVSLPFSVFISAYLILINIKNILKSGVFKILLLYFIFILIIKYLYFGIDYQMIKVMGWMLIFISSTYAFRKYFEKKISIHNVMNAEKYYIFYPLLLILLISLLGFFAFNLPKDSFLISEIKVYSYSQYFAFVFILLLGSSSRSSFSFIVVFTLVVLISYTTKNTTALILAILLACYFFADKIFTHRLKRVFRNIVLVAVFSLIIFYSVCITNLKKTVYAESEITAAHR